jgi:hypothetical protein
MQPTISQAVMSAYSNVVTVHTDGTFASTKALDVYGNQVSIDETTVNNALTTLQTNYTTQQQAEASAKASAIAKLTALGLTADEISALVG